MVRPFLPQVGVSGQSIGKWLFLLYIGAVMSELLSNLLRRFETNLKGKSAYQLVRLTHAGRLSAYGELIFRHQNRLMTLAYYLCCDPQWASETLERVCIKIHHHLRLYPNDEGLILEFYREVMEDCIQQMNRPEYRTKPNPENLLISGENIKSLPMEDLLRGIPLDLRVSIILCDILGLPISEVAHLLRISEGTARSRVHNARMKLKNYFREAQPA